MKDTICNHKCTMNWLFLSIVCFCGIKLESAQECEVGKYGTGVVECDIDCPTNCKNSVCDKQTGECSRGCNNWYEGTRCSTSLKCRSVSGDPRGKPQAMNTEAGPNLNIFVNLTFSAPGRVSVLQFRAFHSRTVFIGFWRQMAQINGQYHLQLVDKVQVSAVSGFNEIIITDKNVMVETGDAIGIHYTGSAQGGAIFYHRSDNTADTHGIDPSSLYGLVSNNLRNNDLPIGINVSEPLISDHLRTASVRVFTECNEACVTGMYGNNSSVCSSCSRHCRSNLICDPKTGACPAGCEAGWRGRKCKTVCSEGTYGGNCLDTCDNCKDNNCDAETGFCRSGCKPGYTGALCNITCSQGRYGNACNLKCSNLCEDVCHYTTGSCTCSNGEQGPTCEREENKRQTKGGENANTGVIAGSVVAAVAVLAIAILTVIVLCRKRKQYNRKMAYVEEVEIKSPDLQEDQHVSDHDAAKEFVNSARVHKPNDEYEIAQQNYANDLSRRVLIKDLESYITRARQANPEDPFKQEYLDIPTNQTEKWNFANQIELKPKNRFKNILPYDHNRVKLQMIGEDPLTTYINASFLPNFKRERAYIASSGPSRATLEDFWRMVWENNVKVIVMVTKLVENMAIKCEQYWPENPNEVATYGDVRVTVVTEDHWVDFESRIFAVTKNSEERRILHLTYIGWPDHEIPEQTAGILTIRKRMLQYQGTSSPPIVVHCSAGIGRTGTFIAIDYLLDQGKAEDTVDVFGFVSRLRSYRVNMVQTQEQYEFIYKVLCETLSYGQSKVACADFKNYYETDRKTAPNSKETPMKQKYEFLERLNPQFYPDEFEAAKNIKNMEKNRDNSTLPAEKHRVYFSGKDGRSIYINAVYVNGYKRRNEFIVTQVPLKTTCSDFWSFILEMKCSTIVCLEDATDGTIWYPGPEGPMMCENTCVRYIETKLEGGLIQHCLLAVEQQEQQTEYANIGSTLEAQQITVFYLPSWAQVALYDRNPNTLIQCVNKVYDWQNTSDFKGPITVVCLNGAKESGLYIAASNLISMASTEKEVDIFQTTKAMRCTRPQFIQSLEQYEFLHDVILAYLGSPHYKQTVPNQ